MRNVSRKLLAGAIVLAGICALTGCGSSDLTTAEHLERAREFQAKGEVTAVVIELKNVLDKDPGNIDARVLLGQTYLGQGAGGNAEKEFRRAIELGLTQAQVAVPLARAQMFEGQYEKIVDDEFDAALLAEPERTDLFALRGDAYLALGDLEAAEQHYDMALEIAAGNPRAAVGKATLASARNDAEAARRQLDAVLQSAPDFAPALRLRGLIEADAGNLEAAETDYTEAMKDPAYRDQSRLTRALLRVQMKKFDKAAEDIAILRKQLPKSPNVDFVDGLLQFEQGRMKEAGELFDAVLGRVPEHASALFYAGAAAARSGNEASAKNHLGRYLSLNPGHIPAQRLLAQLELEGGDPETAKARAMAVLEQAPENVLTLNLLADASLRLGDQGAAIAYMKRAAESDPESSGLRVRLGSALVGQGSVDEGLRELQRAIELDPASVAGPERMVNHYIRVGDRDKALEIARAYVDRQPESAPGHALLGMVFLTRNEMEDAGQAFDRARQLDPEFVPAYNGLALAAIQAKQLDKAEAHLLAALERAPKEYGTRMNLARVNVLQDDWPGAESVLRTTIEAYPTALEPRLMLGQRYLSLGQTAETLQLTEPVISRYPDDNRLVRLHLSAQLDAGRYIDAKRTLKRLEARMPKDATIQFGLAEAHEGLGEFDAMRESLERAAALDPGYLPAQFGLASLAVRDKNASAATKMIDDLRKRVDADSREMLDIEAQLAALQGDWVAVVANRRKLQEMNPNSTNLRQLALALWRAGQQAESLSLEEHWAKQHPDDLQVRLEVAQRYLSLGRRDDAIAAYRAAIDEKSDNALALNNLAWILAETDPKAALDYAERAHAAAPESAAVMDTLAGILLRTGDTERAARMIDRALAKEPENPSFRYRRALQLEAVDNRGEAIQVLQELLARDADFAERASAEAMLARLKEGP